MDAKRMPAAQVVPTAPAAGGASDPLVQEHSWLVFRLGPHTMCASTLDVEGIIEPCPVTPLPFTPAHVLGSFMFRGRVATAISLRRKLAVNAGEDSAQGPFVVARVGEELAAFWVDEVKEVMGEQGVAWQPMPDMLRSRVFDQYTIVRDELVLHTRFASLLEADAESIPARWRAERNAASAGAPTGHPAGSTENGSEGARDDHCARPAAEPALAAHIAGTPEDAAVHAAGRTQEGRDSPADPAAAPPAREEGEAVPPRRRARAIGTGARPMTTSTPAVDRKRSAPYGEAAIPQPKPSPDGAGSRAVELPPFMSGVARGGTHGGASRPDRATPIARRPVDGAGRTRPVHAEAVGGPRSDVHQIENASSLASRASAPASARRPRRARALAGTAVALCAALVAAVVLWPDGRSLPPSPAAEAENRAQSPVLAEPAAPPPASDPARGAGERVAEAPAPAQPERSRQVAALESDTLSVTIERPTKPADESRATGTRNGAGAVAAHTERQAAAGPGVVHVVVRGDTLWDISRKYLGNPFRYPELVRLSGIKNPDLIRPGDIVRIRINE